MTAGTQRNARIDVVRGFAIGWVLLHHFWNVVDVHPAVAPLAAQAHASGYSLLGHALWVLEGSSLGIKLFWFVSGFCIHSAFLSWWERRADAPGRHLGAYWRGFFIVRFWRIYPPYLIALLAIFTVEYWDRLGEARSYRHLALHLACIHNYFAAFIYNINYSFWSIAIESQRYLLYPLLLLVWLRRGPLQAFLVCMAFSLTVRLGAPALTDAFWADHNPVGFWFDWLIGAVLAERWRERRLLFRAHGPLLFVVGSAFLASFAVQLPVAVRPMLQPLVYAIAFEWFIHRTAPLGVLERRIAALGAISYSVFLLHEPFFRWGLPPLAAAYGELPAWLVLGAGFGLALVPVVATSWCYHRWIEVPFNAFGKRLARARADSSATTLPCPPLSAS